MNHDFAWPKLYYVTHFVTQIGNRRCFLSFILRYLTEISRQIGGCRVRQSFQRLTNQKPVPSDPFRKHIGSVVATA